MDAKDLHAKLQQYEGQLDSIISLYKEATAQEKLLKQFKAECLAQCQAVLAEDGVIHHKSDSGTCGFSSPKSPKLDKAAWEAAVAKDDNLKQAQVKLATAQAKVKALQVEYMVMPEGKFFIR